MTVWSCIFIFYESVCIIPLLPFVFINCRISLLPFVFLEKSVHHLVVFGLFDVHVSRFSSQSIEYVITPLH